MTLASSSTAVNLSRLPFPAVVETISFETLVSSMKTLLVELVSAEDLALGNSLIPLLQLESEPLVKLIEILAYREMMLRTRVNDSAKGMTLAYAIGADLDNLAALMGVFRLELQPADPATGAAAIMETDTALRTRVLLAPEGFSVAGPEGAYVFHALSADGDVLDASATSPAPGEVVVTVLSRVPGGVADADLLALVTSAVSAEDVRPLTDMVTVTAAEILTYAIVATVTTFSGPDSAVVLGEANIRLQAYLADNFRLGRDITRASIIAALHAEGVQNVVLASPPADIVISRLQAARCTAVTITHAGQGE